MNYSTSDFIADLYERCLLSNKCPFTTLGKEITRELNLWGLSIWSQHPSVREAASRIVFFQSEQNTELVNEDQKIAQMVLHNQKNQFGNKQNKYYWASTLCGIHSYSSIVVWSTEILDKQDYLYLENLTSRLTALLDLIILRETSNSNRVVRELKTTQFIQHRLLPPLKALGGKNFLSYRSLPVHELGGDYLDILRFPQGSVGLTVGDAMGKGVPGAFVMLIARTIFRFIANERIPPHKVLAVLNTQFRRELDEVDTFVTLFYCIYDPLKRSLTYANAGHNKPILYRKSEDKALLLSGNGVALGVKEEAEYQSHTTQLELGDILIIFSDGLRDIRNEQGQDFGAQRIIETVEKFKEYSADGICDGLIRTVMAYSSVQADDISLLILKAD